MRYALFGADSIFFFASLHLYQNLIIWLTVAPIGGKKEFIFCWFDRWPNDRRMMHYVSLLGAAAIGLLKFVEWMSIIYPTPDSNASGLVYFTDKLIWIKNKLVVCCNRITAKCEQLNLIAYLHIPIIGSSARVNSNEFTTSLCHSIGPRIGFIQKSTDMNPVDSIEMFVSPIIRNAIATQSIEQFYSSLQWRRLVVISVYSLDSAVRWHVEVSPGRVIGHGALTVNLAICIALISDHKTRVHNHYSIVRPLWASNKNWKQHAMTANCSTCSTIPFAWRREYCGQMGICFDPIKLRK